MLTSKMYDNPYLHFYRLQAGGDLAHYEGVRYQRGRGWFKKLGGRIMPALKYLGKNALAAATSFLGDVAAGRDVKTALKRTALDAGSKVAEDISQKVRKMASNVQSGSGVKRRKTKKTARKTKAVGLYREPSLLKIPKVKRKTTKRKSSKKK